VLSAALDGVDADGPQPNLRIAGYPAEERSLRDGLEAAYRGLAGLTEDPHERISLVDQANLVRRWTLR
jgi:serine/threonine-protein kinase PknG